MKSIKQEIWAAAKQDINLVNKAIAYCGPKQETAEYWERVLLYITLLPDKPKRKAPRQPVPEWVKERYNKAYHKYQSDNFPNWVKDGHTLDARDVDTNTSNGLTTFIDNYLTWCGHFANRTGNEGRVLPDGTRIKSSSKNGMQDIDTNIKHPKHPYGIPWKIEIKVGKDTHKENQKRYGKLVQRTGGHYSVVRNAEDFFKQLDELLLT